MKTIITLKTVQQPVFCRVKSKVHIGQTFNNFHSQSQCQHRIATGSYLYLNNEKQTTHATHDEDKSRLDWTNMNQLVNSFS